MSKNGLHLITPTSIASTGTGNSSSISANGSVTFSTCATLSLNGVFSADYDNYTIVLRCNGGADSLILYSRFRTSGSDASGSDYTTQELFSGSTTIEGSRRTETVGRIGGIGSTTYDRSGFVSYIYGPYLAQPTAFRSVSTSGYNSSNTRNIYEYAGTHSLSTSYDGITIYPSSSTFDGRVAVYGMRK